MYSYSLPGLADNGDEDVSVADDGEGDDDGHDQDLAPPNLVVGVRPCEKRMERLKGSLSMCEASFSFPNTSISDNYMPLACQGTCVPVLIAPILNRYSAVAMNHRGEGSLTHLAAARSTPLVSSSWQRTCLMSMNLNCPRPTLRGIFLPLP